MHGILATICVAGCIVLPSPDTSPHYSSCVQTGESTTGFDAGTPAVPHVASQSRPKSTPGPTAPSDELSHLPANLREDILTWRHRIESARCIKVVCETEETWARLYEPDSYGLPTVNRRERFQCHAWMTPRSVLLVVFPYTTSPAGEQVVDHSTPAYELFWDAEAHSVRERVLLEDGASRPRRYITDEPYGPGMGSMPIRGCIYATVMQSWLAGGPTLGERCGSAKSLGLTRVPNIAIVPPDINPTGVWFDVFDQTTPRDEDDAPDQYYRRHDLMHLTRDHTGQPIVSEWRTIVLNDEGHAGLRPSQIVGSRRLSYQFYSEPPEEFEAATRAFVTQVDEALAITQATSIQLDATATRGSLERER